MAPRSLDRAPGPRAGAPPRRTRRAALLGTLLALLAAPSRAADYRRPGLEGRWSERHLTAPLDSLRIVAGPGQPSFFGQRYAGQVADGGGQYLSRGSDADEWWVRAGLGFGLTEDWEASVLFLPFRIAPDFSFESVTVAITRGFRFRDFDVGLRLSFQTPGLKAYDWKAWGFNPALPLLYRAGPLRIDLAPSLPLQTSDGSAGVNVPLRVSFSASTRIFFGVESGFVEPRFATAGDTAVPLGVLLGYTELFGSKVVDFTASFGWDDLWLLAPPEGSDTLTPTRYRAGLGLVFHTLVR